VLSLFELIESAFYFVEIVEVLSTSNLALSACRRAIMAAFFIASDVLDPSSTRTV